MASIFLAIIVFCLAFGGLALGLIWGREPIKGSCGGLACIPGTDCAACPRRDKGGVQ